MKKLWAQGENQWDAFLRWAGKFYEWDGFDKNERDYKLQIATDLKEAKDALLAGEEAWVKELKEAFGSQNNLSDSARAPCQGCTSISTDTLRGDRTNGKRAGTSSAGAWCDVWSYRVISPL